MPKVIHPRRHDKGLSVEQFWAIKDEHKTQEKIKPNVMANREEQVHQRHRYQRQKDLVKNFDPLAYFLRKESLQEKHDQTSILDEDDDTYVRAYLESVRGQLSPPLVNFKKLVNGKKLINHNYEKIYQMLWENLKLEDAWPILQAVIRDTKPSGLEVWLN